jgi:hypothetical protein
VGEERVGESWKWAGAVGLRPMPTHDDGAVMNGAPGFVVGLGDGRGRSRVARYPLMTVRLS